MKNQYFSHPLKHQLINVCVVIQRKGLQLAYKIKWLKCKFHMHMTKDQQLLWLDYKLKK